MSLRMLEAGIQAIQQGNKTEGARLLRIAVKSGELTPELCAIAFMWLAETTDDTAQKRQYYTQAIDADPASADARQRLASLLAAQLPPVPSTVAPAQPRSVPEASQYVAATPQPTVSDSIAAVIGGPNGPGTAFFISEGLLATTRYVVGGMERVTLELGPGQQINGQVVRAFPELDLAFIHTDARPAYLPPVSPQPRVPDESALVVYAANGQQLRGTQRPTKRVMAPHWFTTSLLKLADAGGNPVFDGQNYLLGMMTKNSSRASGYLFGVEIATIRRAADSTMSELNGSIRRAYCPHCGSLSRATAAGYFYCEICGAVTPQARTLNRHPQGDPFAEVSRMVCTNCGAQVGYYNGRCLRCGQVPNAVTQ